MTRESGITLHELLIVLALMGVALSAAIVYLKPAEAPLQAASVVLEGTFRQARLQAIANTSAYRVSPDGTRGLKTEVAGACSDTTWEEAPGGNFELPEGVSMTDTSWHVCFTSRGISTDNEIVTLSHARFGTRQVEVLIGGTTRVL